MKHLVYIFLLGLISSIAVSQENFDDILFEDFVYYDHIKSVTLSHQGIRTSLPIIDLNKPGYLRLDFDDLEAGDNYYTYRIIHCDKDWKPSDLDEIEYMEGYNGEELDDYRYAVGTINDYTHYNLILPNEDIIWTISGNYLLVIYEGNTEEGIPVISRRFMVTESSTGLAVRIDNPLQVSKLKTHHQIEFSFGDQRLRINNPLIELSATILQNGRWDVMLSNQYPKYQAGNRYFWRETEGICIPALKEFRSFDFRSFKYTSEFVHSIDLDDDGVDVLLDLAQSRTKVNYISDIDANGRFIIDNRDKDDYHVTADYARVTFSLERSYPYEEDVYVIGAFTDWRAMPEFKLDYDSSRKLYVGQAFLKQGYYDFMFGLEENETIDCTPIEGSWYETNNEYTVLLYYSEFGARYDRLLSVANVNSGK